MEIIKKIFKESFHISKIFHEYTGHLNSVFLDIETTGINPNLNKVILVGILKEENNVLKATQIFAEDKNEEKELLQMLADMLKASHMIYNYNATSFDIPFLNKRFQKNNIDFHIPSYYSFDLYRIIKNYEYINLPNYKLKTIEKYLGIERSDVISGKESITLYNQYIKSKDSSIKEIILKHNLEDIYYLTKVLSIIKKYDFHKIMFENPRYIRNIKEQKIVLTKSKIKKTHLLAEGFSPNKATDFKTFSCGYSYHLDHKTGHYELHIPLYSKGAHQYILLSDFDMPYEKVISYPHIPDDILIINDNGTLNYIEINAFLDALISHLIFSNY